MFDRAKPAADAFPKLDPVGKGPAISSAIPALFDPVTIASEGRPATRARLFDATQDAPWRGSVTGGSLGGSVTVLTYGTNEIGAGPQLHVHPYDETFVVMGIARFFVGDTVMDLSAGEVAFGPAGVPYRFENTGPGRLQTIDIHHSLT